MAWGNSYVRSGRTRGRGRGQRGGGRGGGRGRGRGDATAGTASSYQWVRPVEAVASVPLVQAASAATAASVPTNESSSVTALESHLPEASAPASPPAPVVATTTATTRAPILSGPTHPVNRATSWRRDKADQKEECAVSAVEEQAQEQVVQSPVRNKKVGAGGGAVHQSHKWVRPVTTAMHVDGNDEKVPAEAAAPVGETENAGTGTAAESSDAMSVVTTASTTIIQTASEEPEANTLPAPTAANHTRRGRNKLVLSKGPQERNESSKNDAMDSTAVAATAADKESLVEPASAAANHTRRGRNKLVLSKGPEEHNESSKNDASDATTAAIADEESQAQPASAAANLKRRGRHKLVLSTDPEESHEDAPDKRWQQQHPTESYNSMPFVSSKRGRKRPRQNHASAVPKRIKMAVPGAQEQDDQEGDGDDGSAGEHNSAPVAVTEKLTDFTYRETSAAVSTRGRGRGRGRGSSWGGRSHPPARSMGLARVVPDVSTTPICRSFLRGMTCVNETCTMRHDIPKEFAQPICSYFQSHGMCLKKDCPFRHIKVNPHATACPSFALLGFCETPECTMQHTRARPQNNNLVWKSDGQG